MSVSADLGKAVGQSFDAIGDALASLPAGPTVREVGTVTAVATGIATVAGLPGVGFEELVKFPESWFWGNTCETKSWYPMVAAMNDYGRKMDVIDYVPCYRSEAGTGQGMIFASWN